MFKIKSIFQLSLLLIVLFGGINSAAAFSDPCNPSGYFDYSSVNIPSGSLCTIDPQTSGAPQVTYPTGGFQYNASGRTNDFYFPTTAGTNNYRYDLSCTNSSNAIIASATANFPVNIPSSCPTTGNTCTGTIPANASSWGSGESTGLSASTPWVHATSSTAAKCEFRCDSGSTWNGSSCVAGGPIVPPGGGPTVNLWADPTSVVTPDGSHLFWTTQNAVTCQASSVPASIWTGQIYSLNNPGPSGGYAVIPNSDTTYRLTCTDASGVQAYDEATITVTAGTPMSTAYLSANPTTIYLGESLNLNYSAYNVSWCTSDFGFSANPSSYNVPYSTTTLAGNHPRINSIGLKTFELTCGGSSGGGNMVRNASVQVIAPPSAKFIVCPTSATIPEGGIVNLESRHWTATTTNPTCSTGGFTPRTLASAWTVPTGSTYASVSSGAVVTGNNEGSATVRATYSGLFASSNITVTADSGGGSGPRLIICPDNTNISVGGTASLSARYFSNTSSPNCSGGSIVTNQSTWTSKDSEVTSQGSGAFFGNSLGIADVTASYDASSGPSGVEVIVDDSATVTVTDGGGGGPTPAPPVITIIADPKIVRSGETADVDVSVTSDVAVACTLYGAATGTITLSTAPGTANQRFSTVPLTSARIVRVICNDSANTEKDARIDVIPTFQEI